MDDARWDDLVADLEGQALAHEAVEGRAHADDLARAAIAELTLEDRLRANHQVEVVVAVRGAGVVRGRVAQVGGGAVLLDEGGRESLVLLHAVLSVTGLGPEAAVAPSSAVERAWGVGHLLRRHARDRAAVRVVLDTGDVVTGTLDAVGADHVEIAEHPAGEPRRRASVVNRRLVPFVAIAVVARDHARS